MSDAESRMARALELALERGEIGLQAAVYVGDELVVDASAGVADREAGRDVDSSTLFPVFSVTKAVTATALHVQAERGLVDYDSPIARYWPEFGAHGKGGITVRDLLTHRSGLPQMPPGTTPERMGDWDWVVEGIADLEPLFPPGTQSSYEALSFGWLAGEIVRRTDPHTREFSAFVQAELFEPLGIEDFHIGLPPAQQHRVATLYAAGSLKPEVPPLRHLAMPAAVEPGPAWNDPVLQRACAPGVSGISNARAVARFFAMLAGGGELGGVRVLAEERVRAFAVPRPHPTEHDGVLGMAPLLGQGGFWIGGSSSPARILIGTDPRVLAHPGAGGSIGWADPNLRLAVGIAHNRLFSLSTPPVPGQPPFGVFEEIGALARQVAAERRSVAS